MRDYTGCTVYLGMDVHKLTYAVTAICEGVVVKRDTLKAEPSNIITYCKRFFPNGKIKSAYEAGFCGFKLHRELLKEGIDNIVVHPASIEIKANDRIKNDKRDSLKIASQLAEKKLTCVCIPTLEQEGRRSISRQRNTFAQEKTRASNRIKGFLYYHGLIVSSKRMSKKFINSLNTLNLSADLRFSLDQLISTWKFFDEKIKENTTKLEEQASVDKLEAVYRSAPGIGSALARMLSNELGDMAQFSSEKSLFSYCGLTPTEHSSGESIRRGHISRQGKPTLRQGLTQAAWVAIRKDEGLAEVFMRISQRAGAKKAIQAIARKLMGKIRACIRDGKLYECKTKRLDNELKEVPSCEDLAFVT